MHTKPNALWRDWGVQGLHPAGGHLVPNLVDTVPPADWPLSTTIIIIIFILLTIVIASLGTTTSSCLVLPPTQIILIGRAPQVPLTFSSPLSGSQRRIVDFFLGGFHIPQIQMKKKTCHKSMPKGMTGSCKYDLERRTPVVRYKHVFGTKLKSIFCAKQKIFCQQRNPKLQCSVSLGSTLCHPTILRRL